MLKNWNILPRPDENDALKLARLLTISPVLSRLLIQRGVHSYEQAESFFRLSLKQLHDPFLMKDMGIAVERVSLAIRNNQKVLVYGDYDVDGTTSVALVYSFLTDHIDNLEFYIPDRYSEGYGVSEAGIQYAADHDFDLIISLDCGIKAFSAISMARANGIDFIVCDHHRPDEDLPNATAILNPKRNDCEYPYKELSGCGVGFKLLQALTKHLNLAEENLWGLLDLVAVSIAADIVPITNENRVLCHFGLRILEEEPRPGLAALIKVADIQKPLTVTRVVFGIAPRINAAGRIEHAHRAVELLLSKSSEEADYLASAINQKNNIRRETEQTIVDEAIKLIDAQDGDRYTTVLYKAGWHKGVIGIVASKCIEHFYRPTIILTESNGMATGSARSVRGYDIHEAIEACSELLEQFGGHKYAAGLTMKAKNVPAFQQKFEEVVRNTITPDLLDPTVTIDEVIELDVISKSFLSVISQMEPFGPGNMKPVFATRQLRAHNVILLKDQHIKLNVVNDDGVVIEAIGFYMPELYPKLTDKPDFDMAFTIEENNFKGKSTIQLHIKDIKFAEN